MSDEQADEQEESGRSIHCAPYVCLGWSSTGAGPDCQRGELSVRGLARTRLKRVAIRTNVNDGFNEFDRPVTRGLTQVSREAATGDV